MKELTADEQLSTKALYEFFTTDSLLNFERVNTDKKEEYRETDEQNRW
ncbi:MAG: hypothetical protein R3B65_03465 [Candidatus Paceibacterota bacterium]